MSNHVSAPMSLKIRTATHRGGREGFLNSIYFDQVTRSQLELFHKTGRKRWFACYYSSNASTDGVSAKMDDEELYTISAFHVKLHSMAIWAINVEKEQIKKIHSLQEIVWSLPSLDIPHSPPPSLFENHGLARKGLGS